MCLLVLLWVTEAAAAPTTPDSVACAALIERVANSSPNACMNRHCGARCIPPLADEGRCGSCQANCALICERVTNHRRAQCAVAPSTDGEG